MDAINIFGTLAAVLMVCGYLPQAVTTIRTRNTDGISILTFSMMGLGALFFAIQGILTDNLPLTLTIIITMSCSAIIFGIKVHNDYFRKK